MTSALSNIRQLGVAQSFIEPVGGRFFVQTLSAGQVLEITKASNPSGEVLSTPFVLAMQADDALKFNFHDDDDFSASQNFVVDAQAIKVFGFNFDNDKVRIKNGTAGDVAVTFLIKAREL